MDGPLVSTIASVSVRDGGYLLLLVVVYYRRFYPVCRGGERVNDKGWGGEQERKGKNRGSESVERGRRETACGRETSRTKERIATV